jgi:hypothetical protein
MFFSIRHRTASIVVLTAPLWLAGCVAPPKVPAEADATPLPVAPLSVPIEAEPAAPSTQPASLVTQGPMAAMLAYAEKVRGMSSNELSGELARLGDPGDSVTLQMQVALALSQTRAPVDLARALGLLQRVSANPSSEAKALQPLARTLASRYMEQRRVEDDRDRQVAQLRDAQRRIDQLNERMEALRAIERSFARPNPQTPAPPAVGAKTAP